MTSDVIVVGAGAAGLAAARTLSAAGRSVIVVEARERAGGRAWTLEQPGLDVPIELGPEFVHGRPPEMQALLRAAGIVDVDVGGERYELRDGRLEPGIRDFEAGNALIDRAGLDGEPDESVDAFLDRCAADPAQRAAAESVRTMVRGFDAADPARASVRAIAQEWRGDASLESGESRPIGGYGRLFHYLVAQLDRARVRLLLRCAIDEVRWSGAGVTMGGIRFGERVTLEARAAIVTLPIGVLQTDDVRFTPALPARAQAAIAAIAAGHVVKVLLHFRDAFWETIDGGRYAGIAFMHAPDGVFPTVWTQAPAHYPVLTAWCGGPAALALAEQGEARIVAHALATVSAFFGRDVTPELVTAHMHDWTNDPFARGAYSYLTVGHDGAREALAAPIGGVLWLAGEAATPAAHAGTVHGAMQSGVAAANALLAGTGNS